jgi:hypothetical protein
MGNKLCFTECDDGTWAFENEEGLAVGWLEKVRVGAWMHWCHFLNDGCYLSPGCADEVREFQRKLGSQNTRKKSEEKK